jgi:hypothetical protein
MHAEKVSAWFIVNHSMSSNDPQILSPQNVPNSIPASVGQEDFAIDSSRLQFACAGFTSPEFQGYESRNLLAFTDGISHMPSRFWRSDTPSPDNGRLTFQPHVGSMPRLIAGEYRFAVDFQETRPFGPLTISRDAYTIVRFFVAQ